MSVTADMFAKLPMFSQARSKAARRFGLDFDYDDLDPVLTIAFIFSTFTPFACPVNS